MGGGADLWSLPSRQGENGVRKPQTSSGNWQQTKARKAPTLLAHAAALAWVRRWTRMLATACAVSFTESLVAPSDHDTWCHTGGDLADVFSHDPR